MAELIKNQLNKMFEVLKRNYPDDHPAMIMECLEKNNITLPMQGQSTVLPAEERPIATPSKRIAVEEASSSGSAKKKKQNSKNPYIDDEAGCSGEDNDNESGAPPVNDASKTKEPEVMKKKVVLPDMEMLKNNIKSMATENRLMRITIPVLPNLNDRTKQSELEVYVRAVKDYYDNGTTFGNWGITIQYAGCYHIFCLGERLKLDYPGYHTTFVDLLKKCQYSTSKIALFKTVGNRFNTLLRYFNQGAFAIAALYSTNSMRELTQLEFLEMIAFIQQDQTITEELRNLNLHPNMVKRTGHLQYIDFTPKKAL